MLLFSVFNRIITVLKIWINHKSFYKLKKSFLLAFLYIATFHNFLRQINKNRPTDIALNLKQSTISCAAPKLNLNVNFKWMIINFCGDTFKIKSILKKSPNDLFKRKRMQRRLESKPFRDRLAFLGWQASRISSKACPILLVTQIGACLLAP